jgi:hypothetical protein
MAGTVAPNIVTDGLVLYLDAANTKSIPLDPTVNLALWSQDFSKSVWSKSTYDTITTGSLAPDGTYTATLINETNAFLNPAVVAQQISRATSTTITYSIYTKKGTAASRSFLLRNNTTLTNFAGMNFLYSISSSAPGWTVQDAGNDWFRLSYTQTTGITPGDILNAYAGRTGGAASGSTATWYVWGAQVESTPYATPYVISTATNGTRNTWQDLSGKNNTATFASSSISGSIPQYSSLGGKVLNFDGTSSYASVLNSDSLLFGSEDFTVSMWIKTPIYSTGEGNPSQWGPIISKGCTTSAPAGTWWFAQTSTGSDRVTFNISSTLGGTFVTSTTTPSLSDGWHSIVFTRMGSTGSLYTDGILRVTDITSDSNLASTAPLFIGSTSPSPVKKTSMNLSQVSAYNRSLTSQEVLQNFNATRTRFNL